MPDQACSLPLSQPTVLCPVWRTLFPVEYSLFHYNSSGCASYSTTMLTFSGLSTLVVKPIPLAMTELQFTFSLYLPAQSQGQRPETTLSRRQPSWRIIKLSLVPGFLTNGDGVTRSTSVSVSEKKEESGLIGCSGMHVCLKLLNHHIPARIYLAEHRLGLVTLAGYTYVSFWSLSYSC